MPSVANIPTLSAAYLEALRDIQCHIVATCGFAIWDVFVTFQDEVDYIWRMRNCIFKCFYFYFRYFLVAAQMWVRQSLISCNASVWSSTLASSFHLAISPSLSSSLLPDSLCLLWYRYAVCISQITVFMIDIILIARVFALFNRSRRVAIFFCALMFIEAVLAVTHVVTFPNLPHLGVCLILRPRHELLRAHSIATLTVQTTILGMFFFKRFVGMKLGWGRTPLLSFLMKDATSHYFIVFLVCAMSLLLCGLDSIRIMSLFYWTISLYSFVGTRLILNMERFAKENPTEEDVELTTHISL